MRNFKTQMLVEGAAMVAMATILSFIKPFGKLPWGGSITLLSMLPIFIFSIRWGIKNGLLTSFVYSIIQLMLGITVDGLLGWGLTPAALIGCIFFDYLGAFTVLGIAGIFRAKKTNGNLAGIALATALRFVFHLLSGVVIFHSAGLLWDVFNIENSWLYSAIYNAAYMLPEMIFSLIGAYILFTLPQTKKLFLDINHEI